MSSTVNILDLEKFKDTCLFSISLRKFGNRAQVRDMNALTAYLEQLRVEQAAESADQEAKAETNGKAVILASDRVKSTKVLVKSSAYDKLIAQMSEIKKFCLSRAMPSYFKAGMFVVKSDQVGALETYLKEAVEALEQKELADFIKAYPDDINNARTAPVRKGGLGPLFRETDYPTAEELQRMFGIEWFWLTLSVPENIPDALKEEATEKFKRRMTEAAEEIENALRVEFKEMLEHCEDRLTTGAGEKKKTFRDSMLGNLKQFIDTFEAKDIFQDKELGGLVTEARKMLLDEKGDLKLDPQKLRDFANVRDVAKASFSAIRQKLDQLIETKPSRRFDLSDD